MEERIAPGLQANIINRTWYCADKRSTIYVTWVTAEKHCIIQLVMALPKAVPRYSESVYSCLHPQNTRNTHGQQDEEREGDEETEQQLFK